MSLILVKNPLINKIPNEFFKSDSWSISPQFGVDIVNSISYKNLTHKGLEFLQTNDVIGYDIQKKIYFTFKNNTHIQKYNENFNLNKNTIYDKSNLAFLLDKLSLDIINQLEYFDFIVVSQ